jgi:hypothetical protein
MKQKLAPLTLKVRGQLSGRLLGHNPKSSITYSFITEFISKRMQNLLALREISPVSVRVHVSTKSVVLMETVYIETKRPGSLEDASPHVCWR